MAIKGERMQSKSGMNKQAKLLLFTFSFVVFACLIFNFSSAFAVAAKHYDELTFPPLPELQLPKYTRFELKNGMRVYLMEDHELPLVGGTALVRTGDRFEPTDKVGLGSLTGNVMRTGGTRQHSPDELNQLLEQRAAAVETGIGITSGSAGFSALSEDLDTVFTLFTEVIREPTFAQDKLDLAKNQEQGAIARRNDDPDDIAGREFQKLIYGDRSPYARTVEYQTLKNISREDLVSFYQQYFHPQNIILGISGDFDTAKMRSLIEQKFGDWQSAQGSSELPLPTVSQANKSGLFFVNQPQLSQSYIEMGHLGGTFNNPDYAALDVMNGVLNGFGGRLFNNVRSSKGLAYSVYAAWSPRFDYPGIFIAGGQTRSEATVPFIQAIHAEIERIRTEKVTPEELAFAKDSTLNSFIFNFEDPSQTLSRLMRYEYYNYPADFIFRYRRQVESTTIADVQRVAKTYLKPDNIVTLVVGNIDAIKPPLTSLGNSVKVQSIDITIPAQS
ncbi:pitrilysin family protein [Kamptonema sp. UHCC 0994]|uniref:M16 family metallopeptidase n=1 Tax=Kamptonema sp. UHCC 0994 TaxID=3031329 RepID=UPI0023B88C25|nr:pitrilysin family protein [Kamptonema sp. UHCC 0994]